MSSGVTFLYQYLYRKLVTMACSPIQNSYNVNKIKNLYSQGCFLMFYECRHVTKLLMGNTGTITSQKTCVQANQDWIHLWPIINKKKFLILVLFLSLVSKSMPWNKPQLLFHSYDRLIIDVQNIILFHDVP